MRDNLDSGKIDPLEGVCIVTYFCYWSGSAFDGCQIIP